MKPPPDPISEVVERLAKRYLVRASDDIDAIVEAYECALEHPDQRSAMVRKIAKISHDMKGQGGSFGYPVMSEIAASLDKFCRTTPNPQQTELELVTAHVDAMRAVISDDLRGEAGETGKALLSKLEAASRKHREVFGV